MCAWWRHNRYNSPIFFKFTTALHIIDFHGLNMEERSRLEREVRALFALKRFQLWRCESKAGLPDDIFDFKMPI
jgi:hypothetical protein